MRSYTLWAHAGERRATAKTSQLAEGVLHVVPCAELWKAYLNLSKNSTRFTKL